MKKTVLTAALAASTIAGAAQAAELRMSWWGGNSRHEATQAALEVCGAKHGHVIKPEFTGWSGHYEKLTTQIAGGTEADIMQVNWPWLSIYSADGTGLADLNTLSDIIDLSSWDADQIEAGSMVGKLNGLPISTTGRLFVFNKSTYAKAGLEVPNTWDELVAAGPVFREKLGEDYYPFEAAKLDAALVMVIYGTQKTGKALIDPETNELAWTKEELTDAVSFYKTLVDNHVIIPWPDVAAAGNIKLHENPNWASGKIAGTYQWDSTYFKITGPLEEGQEVVYHGLLSQDGQKTPGIYRKASMVFSISENSPHKEAAAQIVNCLLNEEEGVAALGSTRGVPASKAAREQLLAADAIKAVQIEAQAKVISAEGPAIHPMMEFPTVRSALEDNLELFAYGEIDAETAADDMIYAINEALEDVK
ncbi:Putative ABC transporter substrate-binding protein YesO [Pelagimonas phthalicica]|uniref:Putative ABC transporter substrate-binding protein YesO n=1 Tax=Pelagimonas phthalicica TaxID=1037362 RepID=A0A238JHV1_9RHOB|nr:ABC transporter substrate-binding protein [Pelagimonas phthalicica]TDS90083.1 oligogalacturonide transport system substrate-binding protein [Pelagimonas phthalicica]SMX30251.1 Putative ABC transporter substrate-binding protein YesO [Pelagimonas phthalicica]